MKKLLASLLGACVALASAASDAQATEVITIGTLAPEASPWGQVFAVWAQAVKQKSGGRMELAFFPGGQQGDEAAMVTKMKSGQLDGAAITSAGMGKIYAPYNALSIPFLITDWTKLDAARAALKTEFNTGIAAAGFTLVGSGDVGRVRLMSKGFAFQAPTDIQGKKPYLWRDDSIAPAFYSSIGGVTPVPLNVPEVLPNLNTGAVNFLFTSALAAEQLQWSSKLDTISDEPIGLAIGAVVISTKRLDSFKDANADLKGILLDTGAIACAALTKRIRDEDDASYGRLSKKMTVIKWSDADRAKWKALGDAMRTRLGQGTFSPDLLGKLAAYM